MIYKRQILSAFFSKVIIIYTVSIAFPGTYERDIAEIFKIIINDKIEKTTHDVNLHRIYEEGNRNPYLGIPITKEGDTLDIGDGIEIFKEISTRIDFTSGNFLRLGIGTEHMMDCLKAMGGESCARAQFKGFREGKPFWYLNKGDAWIKGVILHDDRMEANPKGTEYYVESTRTKTILVVLKGVVGVRPLNIADEILVREGQQIEIVSANVRPNPPTAVNTEYLNEVIKLIRPAVIVIRTPSNGTITDKPSIQLSGLVSDDAAREVALTINQKDAGHIGVTRGKFTRNIMLLDGENVLMLRAMTRYGEIRESISVTKVSAQSVPIQLPNVRGRAKTAAINYLERAGFTIAGVTEQVTGKGRGGVVVDQSPAPGTLLPFGSAVELVVEQPPPLAQVPDLVGRSEREARELLGKYALRMGDVAHQSTGRGKGGTVVTQTPNPHSLIRQGSKVHLVVEDFSKETQEAINRIQQGPHSAMPQSTVRASGRPTGGSSTVRVENATGHTVRIYFSGPQSRILEVPDRQLRDIDLAAGRYQVAAETTDPKIIPFYGERTYEPNREYRSHFVIQSRFR
jgi:hypothetical protein